MHDGIVDGLDSAVPFGNHRDPAIMNRNAFWNGENLVEEFGLEKRKTACYVVYTGNLRLERD